MPTENRSSVQFEREERYIVLKLNRLGKGEAEYLRDCQAKAMADCVVVERDWPEYHLVWAMLEHRMAGKPVPDFNAWRRADELQQRLTKADQRIDDLETQLAEREALLLKCMHAFNHCVGMADQNTRSAWYENFLKPVSGAVMVHLSASAESAKT